MKTYSDQLDSLLCESFGSGLVDITSNTSDLEFRGELMVGEDVFDDRATLIASSAKYGDKLRHFDVMKVVLVA